MTSHPLKRRLARVLVAGAAALLTASLAGCLKMEMNLALDGDQVDGSIVFAVDKEFLAFLDEFDTPGEDGGSASDDFLDDLTSDLGGLEGATVEEYEDDTYIGSRYQFEGMPLSELQGSTDDDLSITYDPGTRTYEVTGAFDMREMDPASADDEEMGLPPGMMQQMLDSFDIVISITFPGEVSDHNGELDGTTVTWRPVVGEENQIFARASSQPAPGGLAGSDSAGGSSTSTTVSILVGLGVLLVGTAAGLGFWLLRRNRRPAEATAGAAGGATTGTGTTDTATMPPPPGSPGPQA